MEIDASKSREDHRPVTVTFSLTAPSRKDVKKVDRSKLYMDDVGLSPLWYRPIGQFLNPDLDVHGHAATLQRTISEQIHLPAKSKLMKPLKQTMSGYTWELVCEKREWRNKLAEAQQAQRRSLLHLVFLSWRYAPEQSEWTEDGDRLQQPHPLHAFQCQMYQAVRQYDPIIAHALSTFRALGRRVTNAMRDDDRAFFAMILRVAGETTNPQQVRQFWACIRRALPKFKRRKIGIAPQQRADFHDTFMPYFKQLESGTDITPDELVSSQMNAPVCQRHFAISDLPSLFEVKDALRATQGGRATGFDVVPSAVYREAAVPLADAHFGLLMKSWLWQHEAVGHKGGLLTVLPERPRAHIPNHFRGIMLLPSYAKRLRALVRQRIIQYLLPQKVPGQLGGMPKQQVSYGSQALRTFCRLMDAAMDARGLRTGVVFLDLAAACHKLLRELVSGPTEAKIVDHLTQDLQAQGFSGQAWLDSQCLSNLLKDLHCQTWFSLGSPDKLAIRR